MNILFIWDGDYPWDIRVDKICSSLVNSNHQVHIACRNLARQPVNDVFKGASIHRLPVLPNWIGDLLNNAISFPAFFSPFWLWHFYRTAKLHNCELIIVRDLPMALGAIWVARSLGIPCILDMAECYPEMLRCTWKFEGRSFRNYFLRNPKLADWVEQRVMQGIDEVWVMIEESRNRLINMGISKDKIRIISNTPVVSRFHKTTSDPLLKSTNSDSYKLIYVGLLNPSRGLDTAIKAVAKYAQKRPNFEFVIIGSGKAESSLKQLVTKLEAGHAIKFLGWVDNQKIPEYISDADVGIVPHYKCSHWDTTIPNKLFDYMAAGKPVIVSNVTPMARIVNDNECGMVYTDSVINELVSVIKELEDRELRARLGRNGQESVITKYNWEKEEQVLITQVNQYDTNSKRGG